MKKILSSVTLVDGTGAPPIKEATIIIDGKGIVAVGRGSEVLAPAESSECWNLSGLTALPGLIDAHVHMLADPDPRTLREPGTASSALLALHGAKRARLTLEAGFTTVRDMAAPNEPVFALRQAVADRTIAGPRIIASGKCLTISGGHGTQYGVPMAWEVDGAEEFLKGVRRQIKTGADFIKVIATRAALSPPFRGGPAFTVEEMQLGINEAHAAGYRVAAHAHTNLDGIRNAVLAGADSIEHGNPADDHILQMMAAKGIILVPTLAVWHGLREADAQDTFPYGEVVRSGLQQRYEMAMDTVRRANRWGVPIALGSDAGNPMVWHGDNALELVLLVEAGLSPMEAIIAGTKRAGEACGQSDQIGTVEPGKLADLIVVDGEPLEEIHVLREKERIKLIIQEGRVVVNRGLTLPEHD